ncbi:hypothetical protein TcCL_NonESM10021 [Trypanosoma cruzi]|nr:hypothetical protein TcCL_NonESM10021 [Trypanosoma cruzi]
MGPAASRTTQGATAGPPPTRQSTRRLIPVRPRSSSFSLQSVDSTPARNRPHAARAIDAQPSPSPHSAAPHTSQARPHRPYPAHTATEEQKKEKKKESRVVSKQGPWASGVAPPSGYTSGGEGVTARTLPTPGATPPALAAVAPWDAPLTKTSHEHTRKYVPNRSQLQPPTKK